MINLNFEKMCTFMEKTEQNSEQNLDRISISELWRNRAPIAYTLLYGNEEKSTGSTFFYCTPLGLIVCTSVCGLDDEVGIYSLSFISKEGSVCKLPPLYNKDGYAWNMALTGKIYACELLGGEIKIVDDKSNCVKAEGKIVCYHRQQTTNT